MIVGLCFLAVLSSSVAVWQAAQQYSESISLFELLSIYIISLIFLDIKHGKN